MENEKVPTSYYEAPNPPNGPPPAFTEKNEPVSKELPPNPHEYHESEVAGAVAPAQPVQPLRPSAFTENMRGMEDPSNPVHYTRDPKKLIAYLIPFPKPDTQVLFKRKDTQGLPDRYMVYTPPPPPLLAPKEGEKEARLHKIQRKWQEEVREAKTKPSPIKTWKGVKGRTAKGADYGIKWITSSNLDFLNRVPDSKPAKNTSKLSEKHLDEHGEKTSQPGGLEELVLIYPSSMSGTEMQIREEFINSLLRTKSKAERDAIIATGLLPIALAIDLLLVFFGGLFEIDAVWLYMSVKGAKTARAVTKRLASFAESEADMSGKYLRLRFVPSPNAEVMEKYLYAQCHARDSKLFMREVEMPGESDILEAIGWCPSLVGGERKSVEDEQWELEEVKDDLKGTFRKGAKEWDKWCKGFERDPVKALKK